MANSILAMQGQAAQWLASTKAALAAAGHGFTAEDHAAIEASHAAHPVPPIEPDVQTGLEADARDLARRVMETDYPEGGLQPDDPRLAPIEGITLAMAAIAARAIGWSTDPVDIGRAARALGVEVDVYERAAEAWRQRTTGDVVLAAFYGQLYSQA
ncbi:MAG: hypothetical protein JWO77_2780 [Ilumatobacteraceae bacterium]|nr:hypothetical protein [Ilumatobacteraceae bacterium]